MRPLRVSIRLPTGIVAPPVSRVRVPDAEVMNTVPDSRPTATVLPGSGGDWPPAGPMPRTRMSDGSAQRRDALRGGRLGQQRTGLPARPVARGRVVELQAGRGVAGEDGVQ